MTEKGDKRVNEIIEAAINEFVEKGYNYASMESIAARANLSKGGLYHHYKSKAEILYAVNLKLTEPIFDMISAIEKNKSIAEGFKKFIEDYLNFWSNHVKELKLYFITMNEAFNNPEILALYRDSAKQEFDYFEAMLTAGQQQSVFKKCDARSHAIALISCLDGFLGYMLLNQSIYTDKIKKEIQNIFINNYQE